MITWDHHPREYNIESQRTGEQYQFHTMEACQWGLRTKFRCRKTWLRRASRWLYSVNVQDVQEEHQKTGDGETRTADEVAVLKVSQDTATAIKYTLLSPAEYGGDYNKTCVGRIGTIPLFVHYRSSTTLEVENGSEPASKISGIGSVTFGSCQDSGHQPQPKPTAGHLFVELVDWTNDIALQYLYLRFFFSH